MVGFAYFNPVMEKKLACHPDLPMFACTWVYHKEKRLNQAQRATGDLVIIASYYLLHVGEYTTKPRRMKKTCTRQFRAKDVTFFITNARGDLVTLPCFVSIHEVMSADAATLCILNQKNGHAGACVHHEAILGAGDG